jgi:hypothetical protein
MWCSSGLQPAPGVPPTCTPAATCRLLPLGCYHMLAAPGCRCGVPPPAYSMAHCSTPCIGSMGVVHRQQMGKPLHHPGVITAPGACPAPITTMKQAHTRTQSHTSPGVPRSGAGHMSSTAATPHDSAAPCTAHQKKHKRRNTTPDLYGSPHSLPTLIAALWPRNTPPPCACAAKAGHARCNPATHTHIPHTRMDRACTGHDADKPKPPAAAALEHLGHIAAPAAHALHQAC